MKNENRTLIVVLIVILVLLLFGGFGMRSFGVGMMDGYYDGFRAWGIIIGIIAIIAAVWVIYDVIVNNKRLSDGMKVLWVICAVLFSIITAIIYYLVGRNSNNDLFRTK